MAEVVEVREQKQIPNLIIQANYNSFNDAGLNSGATSHSDAGGQQPEEVLEEEEAKLVHTEGLQAKLPILIEQTQEPEVLNESKRPRIIQEQQEDLHAEESRNPTHDDESDDGSSSTSSGIPEPVL